MKTSYALSDNALIVSHAPEVEKRYDLPKIKDMPSEDKPREKLLKYGPRTLSLQELVAVILSTGTKKEDVMSIASRVVREYGERSLAMQANAEDLAKDLDIPIVKALQIVATGELGRRFFGKREGLAIIRTAKDVFEYVYDMQNLAKEQLRGIYLNPHYRVIHDEVISIGTIDANIIHPREVFRPAIQYGAAAVVLVHNHPSGIVTPSQADIEISRQLVQAGKIIGINLIDHVVVGKNKYQSIDVEYA